MRCCKPKLAERARRPSTMCITAGAMVKQLTVCLSPARTMIETSAQRTPTALNTQTYNMCNRDANDSSHGTHTHTKKYRHTRVHTHTQRVCQPSGDSDVAGALALSASLYSARWCTLHSTMANTHAHTHTTSTHTSNNRIGNYVVWHRAPNHHESAIRVRCATGDQRPNPGRHCSTILASTIPRRTTPLQDHHVSHDSSPCASHSASSFQYCAASACVRALDSSFGAMSFQAFAPCAIARALASAFVALSFQYIAACSCDRNPRGTFYWDDSGMVMQKLHKSGR